MCDTRTLISVIYLIYGNNNYEYQYYLSAENICTMVYCFTFSPILVNNKI